MDFAIPIGLGAEWGLPASPFVKVTVDISLSKHQFPYAILSEGYDALAVFQTTAPKQLVPIPEVIICSLFASYALKKYRDQMANCSRFEVPGEKLDVFAIFGLHAGGPDWDPAALQRHYRHILIHHTFERNGGFVQTTGADVPEWAHFNAAWEILNCSHWNMPRTTSADYLEFQDHWGSAEHTVASICATDPQEKYDLLKDAENSLMTVSSQKQVERTKEQPRRVVETRAI